MKDKLTDHGRIGLTHHMIFPNCVHDPQHHLDTLPRVLNRPDIEVVDLCVPYGREYRKKAIDLIRKSDKTIIYAGHLLPLTSHPVGSFSPTTREQMILLTKDQVDVAYEVGAKHFIFATGPEIDPSRREDAYRGLEAYASEMCEYMGRKGNMGFLIEPFDRKFDKKFLVGPSREAVKFVERLHERCPQLGIEMDAAHVPLMGETFEDAFRTAARYLRHVHLGNCVLSDPSNPFYGDKHPPIGIEGGRIDTPELARILRILLDIGYLSRETRGSMCIEVRPFPGRSEEETIEDNLSRLLAAWEMVK